MLSFPLIAMSPATPRTPARIPLAVSPRPASPNCMAAAVLPEQFPPTAPPAVPLSPGVADLLRAVLEDALQCLQSSHDRRTPRTLRLAQEAEAWLFSEEERWPFAFVNVCAALGLDPTAIRHTLRASHHQGAQARQRRQRSVAPSQRRLQPAA